MYITLEDVLIVCGQIGAILIISPFILYVVGVIVSFFNVIMEIYDELHKRYGNIVFIVPPVIGLIIAIISLGLQALFGFL